MNRPIIIIGNGGHASVLSEILLEQKRKIIGFTAPQKEENSFSIPYIGQDDVIFHYGINEIELVLGIGTVGDTTIRKNLFHLFKNRGYRFSNVIHPKSIIAPSVKFGEGVQVMAGAIIQTNTILADNIIVNTGAKIDHNCQIESHVHIAPGSVISGGVTIKSSTHIGAGSTIIQGIKIGSNCLVGAGTVVVRDVQEHKKVLGVPAREVNI
ncbi:acetyltransferase [Fervidibacillus albus]|uniref:Acetyltransferase n=1 Tax=Fervidibacillus albus TaxID=2980026 RepID=A0A9E8LZ50_9BACI|nr:acetyltransferase [Fervidibacillus albus]WAA11394.1 acetyltransferase [Fervidibacillus albus]